MPPIAPTALLVAGSMSMTLSPAALVWTMRTVAAPRVAVARKHASKTESLVCMEDHSKLSRHVADPLFPPRRPDGRAAAGVDARLRDFQDQGPAAPPREASRACALHHLSRAQYRVPAAAAAAGPLGVQRRGDAEE